MTKDRLLWGNYKTGKCYYIAMDNVLIGEMGRLMGFLKHPSRIYPPQFWTPIPISDLPLYINWKFKSHLFEKILNGELK